MYVYQRIKHAHYYYCFGEAFCRRVDRSFNDISSATCLSQRKMSLVGGGNTFCTFVANQEVRYVASKTSGYQTPNVKRVTTTLTTTNVLVKKKNLLDALFDFTVQIDMGNKQEGELKSSAKRIKVQLSKEVSKNELTCKSLREFLKKERLTISFGYLDELPTSCSPFNRSHRTFFVS